MNPDKPSLGAWLVGPYREAASFGPRRLCRTHSQAPEGTHRTAATNIEDLVSTAKSVVASALAAAYRGIDDLVELLPPVVQVQPAHDIYGNHGFVPVDAARMRLVDRVLALLVADYLTRPGDFQRNHPRISGTHSTSPWIDLDRRGRGTGIQTPNG